MNDSHSTAPTPPAPDEAPFGGGNVTRRGEVLFLDADMTRQGLRALGGDFDLVVLENVGNLVCPAEFDAGATENATLLSVPEGDDKPLKYPLMYRTCDLLAVTKTDVEPFFDFDRGRLVRNARARNPAIDVLFLSAKTGDGVPALAERILRRVRAWKAQGAAEP